MTTPTSATIAALTELAARVEQFVQASPFNDAEKNARQHFISQLAKNGLVTREEYEIQVAMLAKARAKLIALEAKITALEKPTKPHA